MEEYQWNDKGWITAWSGDHIGGLYRDKEATTTIIVTALFVDIQDVKKTKLVSMKGREGLFWTLTDADGAIYTWAKEHNVSPIIGWAGNHNANVVLHNGKYYMKDWDGKIFSNADPPARPRVPGTPTFVVLVVFGVLALLSGHLFATISKTRGDVEPVPPIR